MTATILANLFFPTNPSCLRLFFKKRTMNIRNIEAKKLIIPDLDLE